MALCDCKKILYKNIKKNKLRNTINIDELELAENKSIEEDYIKKDNKIKLYEALQKLDTNTREVIYLRLTGDLTFKEIGKILRKK